MSSLCWVERKVEESIWGQRLTGGVEWLGSTSMGYYTMISLYAMFVLIVWGTWIRNIQHFTRFSVSVLLWKCSIFLFALTAAVTGLTRLSFIIGVLHNATEANFVTFILPLFLPFKLSLNQVRIVNVVATIYILIEFIGVVFSPLAQSYLFLSIMGSFLDLICFILFLLSGIKYSFPWKEVVAFGFHLTYVIGVFINCLIDPYGRIVGLGLNVFAVAFASLPEDFKTLKTETSTQNEIEIVQK